jgi:ubiquinone/menaquinone biosynthesis C-methylase UbiE
MTLKPGDFTQLAENYAKYRPDYSTVVLRALMDYVHAASDEVQVADVGAGTGLWTRMLAEAGLSVWAVEPNDAMRQQGIAYTDGTSVTWRAGSAERTNLPDQSVDWLTMASSFHWAELDNALHEFHRVLKPGGFLTVLWNPRNIQGHPFHEKIEALVYQLVPDLKRVSSGAEKHVRDYARDLISTGEFEEVIFMEALHTIDMSPERYLGAWKSVNDIQSQAGPERFARLLDAIGTEVQALSAISVPYKTRAWTAQRKR